VTTPGSEDGAELLAAVTELGDALRAAVDASVRTTVDAAALRAAAAAVREVTDQLAARRRTRDQLPALDDPAQFRRVYNPVTGVGSAVAPPLVVRRVEGGVVAEVTLGLPYEGPPSYVHGGMSALLMDQLLGSVAVAEGLWGMTARLELDYRRPVPLDTALVLRAGIAETAGRKVVVTGTIALAEAPEQALVETRGVFVTPRPDRAAEYFGAITDADGRPAPPARAGDATALADDTAPRRRRLIRPRRRSAEGHAGHWAGKPHLSDRVCPLERRPAAVPRELASVTTPDHRLTQLQTLEAESVHVLREVAAESERPVLLFSGGKDSIVMLELARKAFAPARIPFPVMHVDTGLNFPEVLAFRDQRVAELGVELVVASVPDAIAAGSVREEPNGSRNRIQTPVLLDAVEEHGFTALFGGARRDEDKARAKERMFSFRDEFGQWDPKNQRPELWDLYNGRTHLGETIRVFPLSNWTELDIWGYIAQEEIAIPQLYLARERDVVDRAGMLYAVNEFITPREGEPVLRESVRYRTVGDANLTAAVRSTATNVEEVIAEIAVTRLTERGATRGDDKVSDAAMEDRKKEGYF
jgi:sulfate adenylyltransferase subunit 2